MNLDNLQIADFNSETGWNVQVFQNVFGPVLESPVRSQGRISLDVNNNWVWFPRTNNNKISTAIYNFLNSRHIWEKPWSGWRNIWKLNTSPRAQSVIWLLIQGRIKTYDFLYAINLGPPNCCVFCALVLESAEHLFKHRYRTQGIWHTVEGIIGKQILLLKSIYSRGWLDFSQPGNSKFMALIIAAVIWFTWKARCDYNFGQKHPNYTLIDKMAVEHTKVYNVDPAHHMGMNFFLLKRPRPSTIGVFFAAC